MTQSPNPGVEDRIEEQRERAASARERAGQSLGMRRSLARNRIRGARRKQSSLASRARRRAKLATLRRKLSVARTRRKTEQARDRSRRTSQRAQARVRTRQHSR